MKMQLPSFVGCAALAALVPLSVSSQHEVLSVYAFPDSSSAAPSSTTLSSGVDGKVLEGPENLVRVVEETSNDEGNQKAVSALSSSSSSRLRATTTRQRLSSSSRLAKWLSQSHWGKLSKALFSVTMAVTVASLLLRLRNLSSMCMAEGGDLKSHGGGGSGGGGRKNSASDAGSVVGESFQEICRTLGLAESVAEEALSKEAKEKTTQSENFLRKLLKTPAFSQRAIALAMAVLVLSLASTAHADERRAFGIKEKCKGNCTQEYYTVDSIYWTGYKERLCIICFRCPWYTIFTGIYRSGDELIVVKRKKDGIEYEYWFHFTPPLMKSLAKFDVWPAQYWWLATEWAEQIDLRGGDYFRLFMWHQQPQKS